MTGFDHEKTLAELRAFVEAQGMDFAALVAGAARHFENNCIVRRTTPLTPAELNAIVESDLTGD